MHDVGLVHVTSLRPANVRPGGFGLLMIYHLAPFQRSINVRAHASVS